MFYNHKYLIAFLIVTCFFSCKRQVDKKASTHLSNTQASIDTAFTNDLIHETSPYLLQHAHNPVHWKPWGDAAFSKAKKEKKLVILSIGYSSCHWCHVMEEESFENEEVAQIMNAGFVSVKVDREERPDVDMVYQTALELIQGSGGWPLNAIILPDGKPIYLGTYHDKESWKKIVLKFQQEYQSNPEKMLEYANLLTNGIQEVYNTLETQNQTEVTSTFLKENIRKWSKEWDVTYGGNIGEQKFMMPSQLGFLLDFALLNKEASTKKHVELTLDKMLQGGINDHVAGGFFRYSTDPFWQVPHFEKMLYDNAQAIGLYANAFKTFKKVAYKNSVEATFEFLKREMKGAQGGYYSAIDADSDGEEGKFYVWKTEQLQKIVGEDFELFSSLYAITKAREWENGTHILYKQMSNEEFAAQHAISISDLETKIANWQSLLLKERAKREPPIKDDKIITSWNALLVSGLADAYKAFGDEKYLTEAISVFQFLIENNYKNKNLVHSFKEGSQQKEVFLEDYAYLMDASMSLYEITLNKEYFKTAKELNEKVMALFLDSSGLFKYSPTQELITKIVKVTDGVMPSANAIMAKNLLKLGHIEYNKLFLEKAHEMTMIIQNQFAEHPSSYTQWGTILLQKAYPYYEIVVVGSNATALLSQLHSYAIPNALLVGSLKEDAAPLFKDRYSSDETLIYVCKNSTCKLPVITVDEALGQLRSFGYLPTTDKNIF